jgi:hypothetical protein
MPTQKHRISITLEDDTLAILDRFSAASGTPRASVVANILSSTSSELERAARLMEIANAATPELLRSVNADLADATDAAMRKLVPVDNEYSGLIREVKHHVIWKADSGKKSAEGSAQAEGTRLRGVAASTSPKRSPSSSPRPRRALTDPHLLTGGSKS